MKNKTTKSSFEVVKKLFDEVWGRYRIKAFYLIPELKKITEENGWTEDEFELAMDEFNEKQDAAAKEAKEVKVKKSEKNAQKVA